jgi:hypothetical protein
MAYGELAESILEVYGTAERSAKVEVHELSHRVLFIAVEGPHTAVNVQNPRRIGTGIYLEYSSPYRQKAEFCAR